MQSSYMKTKGSKRKGNDEWGDTSDYQKSKKKKDDYTKERKQKRGEEE